MPRKAGGDRVSNQFSALVVIPATADRPAYEMAEGRLSEETSEQAEAGGRL